MKHFHLIMCAAFLTLLAACGDDEPGKRSGERTMQPTLINHIVDNNTGDVTIEAVPYSFVLRTAGPSVGATVQKGTERFTVSQCATTSPSANFYNFTGSNGNVSFLNGIIDLNEGNFWCRYTLGGQYRVVATLPEVFFLSTTTTLSYDNGTSSSDASTMYQFNINPSSRTASITIMSLLHSQEERFFTTIVAHGANVALTAQGYRISIDDADCEAIFRRYDAGTGSSLSTTSEYKLTGFSATLDIESQSLNAEYNLLRMRRSATPQEVISTTRVTATGTVYKQ